MDPVFAIQREEIGGFNEEISRPRCPTADSLAVEHAACHQPSGAFDQKHYREEESRIRESEGGRKRVIYRAKEYRIQMCNKTR